MRVSYKAFHLNPSMTVCFFNLASPDKRQPILRSVIRRFRIALSKRIRRLLFTVSNSKPSNTEREWGIPREAETELAEGRHAVPTPAGWPALRRSHHLRIRANRPYSQDLRIKLIQTVWMAHLGRVSPRCHRGRAVVHPYSDGISPFPRMQLCRLVLSPKLHSVQEGRAPLLRMELWSASTKRALHVQTKQ